MLLRRLALFFSTVVFLIFAATGLASAFSSNAENSFALDTPFYDSTKDCLATSTTSAATGISVNVQSLAQQILANNSISFDGGPDGPTGTQFKRLAAGQKAQNDNGVETDVEPIILVTILHIAQSHKVNVSALTDGASHTAPGNPHGAGKAVDINILDGNHTTGTDSVAGAITSSAAEVLPNGSRFGLGDNGGAPSGTKQIGGKTFNTFQDNPTHVHVDVLGVSQADDDAAVQAAASGATSSVSTSCCPTLISSPGGATTDGTNSAGNEYSFLISKGLSPVTAAAVTGNNIWESGGDQTALTLNPGSVNSIGATGIAQWYRGRAVALHAFAAAQNPPKPWQDLGVQLDYLWHELQTTEKSSLDAVKAQADIASATTTFEQKFEVSGDTSSYPTRIALATKVLQKFGSASGNSIQVISSTGSCSNTSAGTGIDAYRNPLRDVTNLTPSRIDQGVDFRGSGHVYAIGDGTLVNIHSSGWAIDNGPPTFMVYKLSSGPAKDKYVYVAENCIPNSQLEAAFKSGTSPSVHSDTILCDMIDAPPYIEMGWADGTNIGNAAAHDLWAGHDSLAYYTAYGENFSQLLVKLTPTGAPAGTIQAGATKLGSLPAGWPTW